MRRRQTIIVGSVLAVLVYGWVLSGCSQGRDGSEATRPASDPPEQVQEPVWVAHEWDRLQEVILGSPKMMTVPGYCANIEFGFDYQSGNKQWIEQHGGEPMKEVDPAFYGRVVAQSHNLARVLEEQGVTVHRHDPGLLTSNESSFMSDLEKGCVFLFPRDPVIVIGDHVIEAALKLPMRAKEKFAVRRIFSRVLPADGAAHDVQYVAVPSVSPSYPSKDGLYLEGGDVMLNGREIYVGHSGDASSEAGIAWLRSYLGEGYTVHQIDIAGFQHLDCVLSLVRPGLGIRCPEAFKDELPASLADWEFIDVPLKDARKLACNVFVIDRDTVIVDERFDYLEDELTRRGVDVIAVPFDAISQMGGGFRCSHHPIRRANE